MKSKEEFIKRVVNKMGYFKNDYTVVEGGNDFDRISDEITFAFDDGKMAFVLDSCIPSEANETVKDFSKLPQYSVITFDKFNGISIIVNVHGEDEGLNIQPLGVINTFLNNLIKIEHQEEVNEFVEETETVEIEEISLKDYYRLNLPDNKIGRKSDETLIKELKEAGFEV